MREPRWLDRAMVDQLHQEQIRLYGGLLGTRDAGLLESALARPRQRLAYEPGCDLAVLAFSVSGGCTGFASRKASDEAGNGEGHSRSAGRS